MEPVEYGIIGGSGFYQMPGFEAAERIALKTPFGNPSDAYVVGTLGQHRVAFLARHGADHHILPSELNFRANIYGFKLLGAQAIYSASAVGSLKVQYEPGHLLIPDQFVDRTRHRPDTFFGEGIVAHISFADPFCPTLRAHLAEAVRSIGVPVHVGGTYLCMEGPQFSTRAESDLYRSWGMDVIGMTNLQEAKLAREAEICYATLALVTDYDCWHPDFGHVRIEDVIATMGENTNHARAALAQALSHPVPANCECRKALQNAVITRREAWPGATYHRLRPLLQRLSEGKETPA